MTYEELLPVLIQNYGISVIPAKPRRPPYPKGYDINATCEYHRGVEGHSMENCKALKDKVQSLIYTDPIKFRELVSGHQEHSDKGLTRGSFHSLLFMNAFIYECTF